MRGLILSELRRLASRRLARIAASLLVVGFIATGTASFLTSRNERDSLTEGRRLAAEYLLRCQEAQQRIQSQGGEIRCPTESELARSYDRRFRFADEMPGATKAASIVLLLVSFLVGASFVGAEWSAGTMATLLTWEPRRERVFAAKLMALIAACVLGTPLLLGLLQVVHLPAGAWRGTMQEVSGDFWFSIGRTATGATLLSALGAGAGLSLAFALRHTAAAMGVAFGYAAVLDPVLTVWEHGRLGRWLLQRNVSQLLGARVFESAAPTSPIPGTDYAPVSVSGMGRPAALLTCYVAALVAAALVSFRARDVT